MSVCEMCGLPATFTVTGTEDNEEIYRHFCDTHYMDFVNKEIELPAERLEVLGD